MTMPDEHFDELSAYLAGDLDAAAAADLERRLAADPALAARLEALHDALVRLQALDDVEVPAGFGARLGARLDAETAAPGEAAEVRAGGAVVDIGAERARRRALPWAPLGAVAAGIATLAVIVSVVGPPSAQDDMEVADEAAGDAPVAMEAPDEAAELESFDADDGAFEERASATSEPLGAPEGVPVVLDSEVALVDEDAVRERYTGLPEAEGLLGMGRAEADDRAAATRFAVQRSEAFASGVHPGACLDVVTTAADGPVVVARVESAIHEDAAALVYLVATISGQGSSVDRLEIWVVEPDTCATRLFITL